MSACGARDAALRALERCRRDGAWSAQSIDRVIRDFALSERDAALASRLCLEVLQNDRLCDFYIDAFCGKKLEPKLRDILRLGVVQLLLLDKIPDRAAVSECVDLCRRAGVSRAAGLVNAVLRKISAAGASLPQVPGEGSAEYLGIRYSHPLWLARRLTEEHGYEFTRQFFEKNNEPGGFWIQVNTLKVSPWDYRRALEREEIPFEAWEAVPGCLHLKGGTVTKLPGFEEGLFFVQDKAARAAVLAAGIRPGMQVLDACAAPGGKSFAAALELENQGEILSCDLHEKKLRLIREGAERLGIGGIETRARDARIPEESLRQRFDVVLSDVPCSGLGVIRKRPEIRRKSEEELAGLPAVQGEILSALADCVKPGGVLLYSTCTVLRAENRDQIAVFLDRHPDFTAEAYRVGEIQAPDGMYDFWPQIDGTDGFFAAKLRKKD